MPKLRFAKLLDRYTIRDGDRFRLKDFDPDDTADFKLSKDEARDLLQRGIVDLRELQEKLYAQDCWSLLLVFYQFEWHSGPIPVMLKWYAKTNSHTTRSDHRPSILDCRSNQ